MKAKNKPSTSRNSRWHARVIWAIAWKDIVEALKNKNTLAVLLTALPMIFVYYYLPIIELQSEPPLVRVYDADGSVLTSRLEASTTIKVRTYTSEEQMKKALTSGDIPQLGLVIPDGFDELVSAGESAQLQGYTLNWVRQEEAQELLKQVEVAISNQMGQPVEIDLQERVYLEPDSTGVNTSSGISLVFVVTMMGLLLIPHLILEEKKTRTMDMLMVSPANSSSLIVGKAIAGLFYCLLGGAIGLIFYRWLFIHWWLVVLSTVLGALFVISVGLLLGSIIESREQLTMISWVFILPLFLPVFLSLMPGLVPDPVINVLQYIPTVIYLNLLRTSAAAVFPLDTVIIQLLGLAVSAGGVFLMVGWVVRRQDRVPAKSIFEADKQETSFLSIPWMAKIAQRFSSNKEVPGKKMVEKEVIHFREAAEPVAERNPFRIIWAIASKDIRLTLKSKLALSIMIGTAFVLASNAALPLLVRSISTPSAIVYDPGYSTLLRELAAGDGVRLSITNSQEELEKSVTAAPETLLGLVIPEDFDSQAKNKQNVDLEAYVVHWADSEKVQKQVAFFEEYMGQSISGQLNIQLVEEPLYPSAKPDGQSGLSMLTFPIVLFIMGVALVPLLFVEERLAHTLDVLLISPARISEVVFGKALAGVFYCLLAAVVLFLFNSYLIVHWGVALLAVALCAALAVGVGLLVGIISDSPTTAGLWGSLILVAIIALTVVGYLPGINWPPTVSDFLSYLPTSAMVNLFGFTVAGEIPLLQVWTNAAMLLIGVMVILGLVGWRLKWADR